MKKISYMLVHMKNVLGLAARPSPAKTTVVLVAEQLALRIHRELSPGTQLPSEADLALEFNVSRITIREALKLLSGRGLVALARGRKAEVTQPDGSVYGEFLRSLIKSEPKCLFDLLQVRRSLEIQSVTLAARHASRSGLAAIESTLQAMGRAAEDLKNGDVSAEARFQMADVGFHEAMALAGGNKILIYLFEGMFGSLQEAFFSSRKGQRLRGFELTDSVESHAGIFKHVCAGDEKAAEAAMLTVLDNAEKDLLAAYGNPH